MKTVHAIVGLGCLLVAALAHAAYIPLTFTNPPLPATGCALVSVWVRPANSALHNATISLVVRETKGQKPKDRQLNYTRLSTGQWSRLSAWLYPGKKPLARQLVMISAANTAALDVASASLELPAQAPPPFLKGFVRVQGRGLANNQGALLLRGVNITAYSDNMRDDPGQVLAMICPRDYEQIAARGFNAVRLTCWYDALAKAGGWEWLDTQIALARRNGLYIVLDMHAPPGGYQGPDYRGKFWHNKTYQSQLLEWWRAVARRYKDEPAIAAYDLINEPLPQSAAQWYAYARTLIGAIRAEDSQHAIVLETELKESALWHRMDDAAIIYDTHWYEPWEFVSQSASRPFGAFGTNVVLWGEPIVLDRAWLREQFEPFAAWAVTNNVPLQIGEYGVGYYAEAPELRGLDWLRACVSIFDDAHASRFYWSWYPFDFGLHQGWYRRDPGVFRHDTAAVAAGTAGDD